MFGLGKVRLRGVDRKVISDDEHTNDYNKAPAIGRVRFGKLCFYYRDLGRKYYVPYEYIERAFIRISETQPDDSPPIYYYRLILVHKEKEFLPVELKYKTKSVRKNLLRFGEQVAAEVEIMKNQGAQDLGMYDFWKDVRRIEIVRKRFKSIKNGLAVFVTNDPAYLKAGRESSNHVMFSMTEGPHGKVKHWRDKESTCCKTHPDFEVEKEYTIHWDSREIEGVQCHYTIVVI